MNADIERGLIWFVGTFTVLSSAATWLNTWNLEAQLRGCEHYAGKKFVRCTHENGLLTCDSPIGTEVEELIGITKRGK